MLALRFTPAILCYVALAAHFLRFGVLSMMLLCLGFIAFLFVRRPWARRAAQLTLFIAAVNWVWLGFAFVQARIREGQDWHRLAYIMGGVAVFNLLALALLGGERVRAWFAPKVEAS